MQSDRFSQEQIQGILKQAREGMRVEDLCRMHGISEAIFNSWRDTFEETAIRILLFVQDGKARQRYLDALTECGVQVFVTSSFRNLSDDISSQTFHGLLLDLPTKMKALKENKTYVYHLVEKFPVSHLQIDELKGEIRCYHFDKKHGGTLLDFINGQCRNFVPRRIREDSRKNIHLHVLVYKHIDDKRPERSATADISLGGCFIFSSNHYWKEGNAVWLRFTEMPDLQPIHAQIRTVVMWGTSRQMPGIGLKFIDLSPTQAEHLADVLQSNS